MTQQDDKYVLKLYDCVVVVDSKEDIDKIMERDGVDILLANCHVTLKDRDK